MAITLSVTDGTTTVQLTSGGVLTLNYPMETPSDADAAEATVTETIELLVTGTATAIQSAIQAIERIIAAARRRKIMEATQRVYLQAQMDADTASWRSEIVDGRVAIDRAIDSVWSGAVEVGLLIERLAFWEGTEVELQLSTSSQSAATGGRTVRNHDDGNAGDDNWVQIAASQVTGVLPAPARVVLTNTTGSPQTYTRVFLAVNAYSDPANFTHIIEAETRLSGGTVTADASCSSGSRLDIAILGGIIERYVWPLSAAVLQDTQGRVFRLLARFVDSFGSPTVQPIVADSAGSGTLWSGEAITLSQEYGAIHDLGLVPLPPGGYDTAYGPLTIGIVCRGPMIAQVDFLQLTPTDAYRRLDLFSTAVPNNAAIVDDGIAGRAYVQTTTGNLPLVSPRGKLMLYPGMLQKVYILHQTIAAGYPASPIDNSFSVRVYYRPRRPSL